MTIIKICGITNIPDAREAVSLGADALGFIFAPSPRQVTPQIAREICQEIPASIWRVGVFVNADPQVVQKIADYCGLTILQFHGEETPAYCAQFSRPIIKAIRVENYASFRKLANYPSAIILLEGFHPQRRGGTGKAFPWEMALELRKKRNFILSGGLNPENVARAISLLQPWGVDVCSGVERRPREKDKEKMAQFIKEVKRADALTK
jgi:phosphoribosylanthranilate isomerase